MIAKFHGTELEIPKLRGNRNIRKDTPQVDFILSHKSDIEKELGALDQIIKDKKDPRYVVDAMAGCGFSGKILRREWPDSDFIFNDLSQTCVEILEKNFPWDKVRNKAAKNLEVPAHAFVFVDFNSFTLKRASEYSSLFQNLFDSRPTNAIITDSASYGFKFQNRFLKSYGISDHEEYYQLLRNYFRHNWGYWVNRVVIFGSAALVELEEEKKDLILERLEAPVKIEIRSTRGLL